VTVPAPLLVTGGPIWTGRRSVEALGVVGERVVAVGERAEVVDLLPDSPVELDLGGRRAIPGLIDSHIHVLRGGLTWDQTTRWDDVDSLADGLERLRADAAARPPGTWLRVLGGWHPGRFREGSGPTRDDLDAVAPEHPVYVQLLYEEGLLNTPGLERILAEGAVPGLDRGKDGEPTGRVSGPAAFGRVLAAFRRPTQEEEAASTRSMISTLTSYGLAGAIDPGGFGITPESYATMFELWRRHLLDMRIRLYLVPSGPGTEMEDIRQWVRYVQPGFGDRFLRYVGMGEILSFGCHDMEGVRPFEVNQASHTELLEITDLLTAHGWPVHMHAIFDDTISAVLDVWEEVDRRRGLQGRRFSLAHAEPIGRTNLERLRRLGAGIAVQNRLMYRAADSAALWGEAAVANSPPLGDILDLGIPLGAGTDATVVAPPNPWWSMWWLVTGQSLDGAPPRDRRHRLSIEQALTAYTRGSAWFSFEEDERGHLEPGALADVAVLTADPFEVDPDRLPEVSSDLTLVGGRPVHVGPGFTGLAIEP
jgi:predicted amidohydrolase YtcJ